MITNAELKSMWIKAGGSFHGPHIETGTMPENKLLPFLRSLYEARHEKEDPYGADARNPLPNGGE